MFRKKLLVSLTALLSLCSAWGQTLKLGLKNHESAVYKAGEPIEFIAEFPAESTWKGKVKTTLSCEGNVVETKEFASDETITQIAKSDKPAWFVWTAELLNSDGTPVLNQKKRPVVYSYGVMVDPFAIRPVSARPSDFEERWASEIAEMRKEPMEVRLIEAKKQPPKGMNVVEVSVSMGKDILPVTGWLSIPEGAADKSLPVVVDLPGANLFPYRPDVLCVGKPDEIRFFFNPHGFPIQDCDRNFYEENYAKKPGGYYTKESWRSDGINLRTKFKDCYYRTVILRLVRALDYLKTLPQWDGKNFHITGGSQGGGLTLIAAALNPDATSATAYIPALCDHAASTVGRKVSWPQVIPNNYPNPEYEKEAVQETAYLDAAHFAPMIKCPITVYAGFLDTTCPPGTIFSAFNSIPESTPKKLVVSPVKGHTVGFGKGDEVVKSTLSEESKK